MSFTVEEICEKLQATGERHSKMAALKYLQNKALNCEDSGLQEVLDLFNHCYLYLMKCYSDRYEGIRDQTIQTVNTFMQRLPPNDYHFFNIISTLVQIMGQQETLEKSEEIRLLFIQQLLGLEERFISGGHQTTIHECYNDIVRILSKALHDDYALVQREACACVIKLASAADPFAFQPYAEVLAKALYGMLNHKHSQSRIAAVNALAQLALYISVKDDTLARLILEVSPLLMDTMPLVRRACGEMGALLLLKLNDRYSFFERLIPLVLCCLKDDSPEVREFILPLWVECGKQYYEENETELSKQEIADSPTANYPIDVQRPTIGCRGIVQRALRVLKTITRESGDWKENVRLHSLKLLYQFVLHAEAAMTAMFFEIYAEMARACRDTETAIKNEAFKVADLMGRLLTYEDWRDHGFEGLERNAKEGYLKCFYYMYTPALGVTLKDNLRLSEILVEPSFSQTLKIELQLYVLKMIQTILLKCKEDKKEVGGATDDKDDLESVYKNCYITTVKVLAITLESDQSNIAEIKACGNDALKDLSSVCQQSLDDLHETYIGDALIYVDNIDSSLDAFSEPILLLNGLIHGFKLRAPYLKLLQEKVTIVFKHCADEAKVKIFSAISMAMLDWNATIRRSQEESCKLLSEFLEAIVQPHISWQAGAHAEAMRSLAMASLCSLSQGAAEEAAFVLPAYSKFMANLLEDHSIATRHYAVKCLKNFGELDMEEMRSVAYALLLRMDDPSSGIRILAASVIPFLRPRFGADEENNKEDRKVWETFIKYCLDLLYLHYDGPDQRLQAAIQGTILELSKKYPEICKERYKHAIQTTQSSLNLKELAQALPILEDSANK